MLPALLALLLLLLPRGADGRLRGAGVTKPDYSYYHKTDEVFAMYESYQSAGCPVMRIQRVSDASGSYKVDSSMVVTVTGAGGDATKKAGVAIGFGEHGRELISAEIGMRLLAMFCAPWAESHGKLPADLAPHHALAMAGLALHKRELSWVAHLLDRVVFKLIPIENPNGRKIVEGGKLCHRMNGRKVDINRNFDIHFGIHPPEYLPSEEYEGTAAFSEPEARITRDAAKSLMVENGGGGLHAFVAIHAGIKELYIPYDYKLEEAKGTDLHAVLDKINKAHCNCRTGSAAKIGGYKAFGTATAYMYEVLKAKYVYTWEVVGDLTASARDCFKGFNPVTHKTYEHEVQNWAAALLMLAEEVVARELPAAVPSMPVAAAGSGAEVKKVATTVPTFNANHPDANPGPRNNAEIG